MRLIIDSKTLQNEFKRLIAKYDKIYWNVAWAGFGSTTYDLLLENKYKIQKIVIGLHFYQTHPEFITTFINNPHVRYIKQPEGTYHPKLYLFYNSSSAWEILIGSSNFTGSGFGINTEVNTLISSDDTNSDKILIQAFSLINDVWPKSSVFSESELADYTLMWKNLRPKIRSLSGQYGSKQSSVIPAYQVPVISMTWNEFISKVNAHTTNRVSDRLAVLDIAQNLFSSVNHFNELGEEERRFIGGSHSTVSPYWGYFGSMIGRGDYIGQIRRNNLNISLALDEIPLKGQIIKAHYDKFVEIFKPIFNGKNYIGVASRLLCMKRPDVFYCLTSKNQSRFCSDFKVNKKEIDYEGYWQHAIERIYDSEWWINPNPTTNRQRRISEYRAAFLDAIYYEDIL